MEVGEVGWGKGFEEHELTHGEGSEQALYTYLLFITLLLCHFHVPKTNTNNDNMKIYTLVLTGE